MLLLPRYLRPCLTRHVLRGLSTDTVRPPQTVQLNYQQPPLPGKTTGRYINQPDKGDVEDRVEPASTLMHDARGLTPEATLESHGFALRTWPTSVRDFQDDKEVVQTYYEEMIELVKRASGASRVYVFDHTLRETGATSLNAEEGGKAAPVPRVHCDYTAAGAPRRLQQLGEKGIFSRVKRRLLAPAEVDALANGRFAFINVWRSISDESPVQQLPLAVCDENTVRPSDRFLYELRFPDRTGENYSLQFSEEHKWYYYPEMVKDECLIFKVYDKKESGPRFVFHTAFTDPRTPPGAPPRRSLEVRTIAFFEKEPAQSQEPVFFDMIHSNNAARIRLWLKLKSGMVDKVNVRMLTYPDLQSPDFAAVNPLKKVPGLIRSDGQCVFESAVILSYLEDKYSCESPAFRPSTPEGRQAMDLMIRIHDLYIASPNCTAPGFSHSQGAMYLSRGWHGPARGMDVEARAAKLTEIWKQLVWLEAAIVGPHLVGSELSLADFTWFPTCVFMEFMLPRVFDWPEIFKEGAGTPFPRLAAWYTAACNIQAFAETRDDIWGYWLKMEAEGQFKPILQEIADAPGHKWRYP
mmetsp:Transcript_55367/g.177598  ORF Transcript_55367/g.177598 Transcript_55367/m.177598 type:complete len:579 (+) Transcript_55367:50-1786(+)